MADTKPVKVLEERHGGISPEVRERLRQQRADRKSIVKALAEGPQTVAQVADATGLPKHEVLWYLMALKKYGEVVEAEEQLDCYSYGLADGEV